MPRQQISFAQIINTATERLKSRMYHAWPGLVQAYFSDEQTADVLPAVNDPRFDPETDERLTFDANGQPDPDGTLDEPWPVIPRVPVAFPRFGGFTIAGPLNKGDRVLLVAFDMDPTKHRITGNVENPIDVGRHTGRYWWCIPTDITDVGRMQDATAAASALVIGKDGAQQQIRIDGANISLGAGVTDFVSLASKVDAAFSALKTYLNAHTHTSAASGSPTSPPVAPYSGASPTGSTLIKAG